MTEHVNHPNHYVACGGEREADGTSKYEAIKVIEKWHLGFCLGNALKYILRAPHKGTEKQDLAKAIWYLERKSDVPRALHIPVPQPYDVASAWQLDSHLQSAVFCIYLEDYERAADAIRDHLESVLVA